MCGIAGVVSRSADGSTIDRDRACGVLQAIRHRGPDDAGQYVDRNVWLGHVRLAILDLSSAGHQPMATRDGRLVITYNGEVYNFRDLIRELPLDGLRSQTDTEVVLRAFEREGPASFTRLNGMFAFALYDKGRRRIWLVRDRLGIKPLYYSLDDGGLRFGSEIKAVTLLGDGRTTCDLAGVHEWLYYGASLGGRTLVRGVRQLPPGHYLELELDTWTSEVRAYWSVSQQAVAVRPPKTTADLIAGTRGLLDAAVRRQLVSDVPVGVFLSGGVDSSAITALASRHYQGRLATYAAGFDDARGVDERPKARRVAQQFGTDHHEIHVGGDDVADLVEKMVRHHDMPFGDAANIPLYRMASQISGATKVVLQGDGGDEVFGGYRRYVTLARYRWLHALSKAGGWMAGGGQSSGLRHRVRRYARAFGAPDLAITMARLLTVEEPEHQPTAAFTPAVRAVLDAHDPFARYRECQALVSGLDPGHQMSAVDLMIELPDVFLEKVDRATMAASLEVRVPFLDHDLVDYVAALPGHVKMPWGRKKWLLKQALTGIVPADVLYGPKTGFSVPFGYWLRTSLKPFFFDHLAAFTAANPGVIEADVVRRWYGDHAAGRQDRGFLLWKLMNLLVWCNGSRVTITGSTHS